MKTRRIIYQIVLIVSLALALLAPRPPVAHAATITVNDAGDGTATPGNCPGAGCRLRDAIAAAASGDTIDFGGDFTINLMGGALPIGKNLTIDGAGHTVTISGPGASCTTCFRVFQKTSLNTLTLNNLTVTNGYSKSTGHGGAIVDNWYGNLNITNCTFSNNSATTPTTYQSGGAIYQNYGNLTITNSTFLNNSTNDRGGAIYFKGTNLTVTGSTFSNNSAGGGTNYGGGGAIWIDTSTTVTIGGSTFSGNSSPRDGGAIFNFGGDLYVTNSTFSGNHSDGSSGGAIANQSTLNVTFSTFSGNSATSATGYPGGGAILNQSSATLRNTLVANSPSGGNCSDSSAFGAKPFTDGGYNLQYGGSTANSCGATIPTADPKLLALANNGGPTQTMALDNGSAALEQIPSGTNGCGTTYTTDQRGYARPGTRNQPTNKCEIGAWEAQTADPTAVTLVAFRAAPQLDLAAWLGELLHRMGMAR